MMYPIGVFVVCVYLLFASPVCGGQYGLLQEMQGRGLNIGGGLTVHIDKLQAPPNASLLERHALRFDYQGVGVRLAKAENQDALKVGLYYGEGRGRRNKLGHMIVPALLGFKSMSMAVMSIGFVSLLVMKSLFIAKVAIVIAGAILAIKVFSKKKMQMQDSSIELDHHPSELHPMYAEYPGDISELGYAPTAQGQYIAYSAQLQDGNDLSAYGSMVSPQYAYVQAPLNSTNAIQVVQKRRDAKRPAPLKSYITVKRKSVIAK